MSPSRIQDAGQDQEGENLENKDLESKDHAVGRAASAMLDYPCSPPLSPLRLHPLPSIRLKRLVTTFAINGLGRIGRALTRIAHDRDDLELVAVNDLVPAHSLARLLARDSVHGRFGARVESAGGRLDIDGEEIRVFQERDPAAIPWADTGARIVVEATGSFTRREHAARHLRSDGPQRVLVSAIVDDADASLCPGIATDLRRSDQVISAVSCTSHCLALVLDVLERGPGVERALMNETHSYTADQCLLDGAHGDPRRARSAAINIVPTRSAAPSTVSRLKGRPDGHLSGMAIRVPTPNVALLELVALLDRPSDAEELRQLYAQAARGPLSGLLAVTDEKLVSSDVVGETASALVDLELVSCSETLCRIVAWYDNEWGYAHRLADMLTTIAGTYPE